MTKLNITDRLQLEAPVLEIGTHSFTVDNSRDTMLAFDEKMRTLPEGTTEMSVYADAIRHFLGEEAAKEIDAMRLTLKGYRQVFLAIMALASEESLEETEARFLRPEKSE